MLFRDWRVGYSQQFESSIDVLHWNWQSHATEEDGLNRFQLYETSHFNKKKMSMLVLMLIEWDTETKESKSTVLKSLHGKLTAVVHYNKKDGPTVGQWQTATFPGEPTVDPVSPAPALSDSQLLSVFLNHLNT